MARVDELSRLLGRLTKQEFLRTYWGRRWYVLRRRAPRFYATLFSSADLDAVLTLTGRQGRTEVQTVKSVDGRYVENKPIESATSRIHHFYKAYDDGFTIIVNEMEGRWQPVARLCGTVQATLHHRVGANLYLTPPGSQGFQAHADDHDVLVLQLEGSKRWRLLDRTSPDGLRRITLRAGDLLYIPRGQVHEAATSSSYSLHLTVGIHTFSWGDLLVQASKAAADEHARLRDALPPGFLHAGGGALAGRFRQLLAELDLAALTAPAVERLARTLRDRSQPVPDGHFVSLNRAAGITANTTVRRRMEMAVNVFEGAAEAAIEFAGSRVVGPSWLAPVFRHIASVEQFRIRELPAGMTLKAKTVLARRLVKEGLLSIVDTAGKRQRARGLRRRH